MLLIEMLVEKRKKRKRRLKDRNGGMVEGGVERVGWSGQDIFVRAFLIVINLFRTNFVVLVV